jgi:hypothetical protein
MRDISFHLEVDENCAFLGYYAESSGNFASVLGQDFVLEFLTLEFLKRR